MAEHDDLEREFDHAWVRAARHKEPSARARMLAARWKHNPPGPVPFRPDPDPVRRRSRIRPRRPRSQARSWSRPGTRSPWVSVLIVLCGIAVLIVLLGYAGVRGPY
jgi:hypothetical protein